jgi:monoamine oxidase
VSGPGIAVDCSHAVIAMPPGPAARIGVGPADRLIPRSRSRGAAVKLHVVYDRPFWAEAGLSGWVTADRGPVRYVVDDSAGRNGMGVLVAFLTGSCAGDYAALPPAQRRAAVLGSLTRWFGPRAARPVAYRERDWQSERFIEGCYASVPEPGWWSRPVPSGSCQDDRDGRIQWAGTERSSMFYGHLEGAVRSGRNAARAIADGKARG